MQNPPLSPFGQSIIGILFFGCYLFADSLNSTVFAYLFGGGALLSAILVIKGIWDAWRWHRLLAPMKEPTGIHGCAYEPTAEDAKRFGLSFDNPDGKGYLVAAKDGQMLFYCGDSHTVWVGSNGSGKSASGSVPIGLSLSSNVVFTGKGIEVYLATRKYRRETLKHEIRHWNPYDIGGVGCDNINLLEDLFPFIEADDAEALEIAANKALLLIPVPKDGGGQNSFFFDYPRAFLGPAMNYAVWLEVETGMLCGNLPYLHDKFCGSIETLRQFLFEMKQCDALEGSIAKAAERFLSLYENPANSTAGNSMLGMLSNSVAPFDPASKVGKSILRTDFTIEDIVNEDMSLYIGIPPDKVQNFPAAGLLIEMLIGISLRSTNKDRRVLHFCLDEFGNLAGKGEIPGISPLLYLGRSLKTRGIFFVQDTSIFERYEEPGAFQSQAECYLASAVRNTKDAEELSKRSGQYSAVVESINLPVDSMHRADGTYSINLPEQAIPNKRVDEILQLKDFTGLFYFKQNPPITVDLVHFQSVQEWRDYAENNPDIELEDIPVKYSLNS